MDSGWLSAARKFGRMRARGIIRAEDKNRRRRKWHVLSGERQTNKLFDHEIVERMGAEFYRDIFKPAVRAARAQGQSHEAIRDRLRWRWKPAATD